jgi:azurin
MKMFALSAFAGLMLSGAALAADKTCEVKIEGNDAMQYNTKELSVGKDCTEVKVTLKHTGKLPKTAMGHNFVLSEDKDMAGLVAAGAAAGVAKDYLPDDAKAIAKVKLVGGGEEASTTFKTSALKAGTSYKYFCTFPGHSGVMNGTFTVK